MESTIKGTLGHSIWLLVLLALIASCQQHPENGNIGSYHPDELFVFEVQPILQAKCLPCHGDDPDKLEGDLDLRKLEGMLKGGESGKPSIIPGEADSSPLYIALGWEDESLQMPPKENDRLSEAEMEYIREWIIIGAPWPEDSTVERIFAQSNAELQGNRQLQVKTDKALNKHWERRRYKRDDLWAYRAIEASEPPIKGGHPIDAFINVKLKENRLKPSKRASDEILIRRAYFDLLGLPPSKQEIAYFSKQNLKTNFSVLVDSLLNSKHYGEQWGRHWLDVARYADSDGLSNDFSRPNAWRYRDYVIRSFNQDKPFYEFAKEQIAGDEIDEGDPEMLVATGFLRMGPWEHTGMSVAAETRQMWLDDITNSVGESFMGQPLRCAKCHDHKFDPIPTRDYYKIQAVFANTQFASRLAPFGKDENLIYMEEERIEREHWLNENLAEQKRIKDKEEDAARKWFQERGRKYLKKWDRRKLPQSQQPPLHLGLTKQDLGYRKLLNKQAQALNREMDRYKAVAYAVYNGPDTVLHSARPMKVPSHIEERISKTFILQGGSVYTPLDTVLPGVLSAVNSLTSEGSIALPYPIESGMQKRRLSFAQWLCNDSNPLFVRTIVNRIWQFHFGKGLVESSNNLGVSGDKPSHPELLDWLCQYFIDHDMSIKEMHRLIMSSDTYQRASKAVNPQHITTVDPNNKLLSYFSPRRMEAEEIRDAMLLISGELNPEAGGIPIRPEIHLEVALQPRHTMGSIARAYQPSPRPEMRNKRSIYAERIRGIADPLMNVFNQPHPDLSCERRNTSSVTPQVFSLFNGEYVFQRSLAMAIRLTNDYEQLDQQLSAAVEACFNRPITKAERLEARKFIKEMEAYHQHHKIPRKVWPTSIEREMFEEMTGELFQYEEELEVYKKYTPDPQASDQLPEVLALADYCRLLFNANEFLFIY